MEENCLQVISNDTYTPEDLKQKLGLGKTALYNFIKDWYKNKENFKVIKIGKLYRIPKVSFDNWFNS